SSSTLRRRCCYLFVVDYNCSSHQLCPVYTSGRLVINRLDVFLCIAFRLVIMFLVCIFVFFFFQAEDGIRDWSVTGVQTCALPILRLIGMTRGKLFMMTGQRISAERAEAWGLITMAVPNDKLDDAVAALAGELAD